MKTCHQHLAHAAVCSLLLGLFSSLVTAQAADWLADDAVKPAPALSPEQSDPPPVRSLGYTHPDPALSPEQTDPPPVESLGYTRPDPALSPEQTNPPPVRSPDFIKPDPALSPD